MTKGKNEMKKTKSFNKILKSDEGTYCLACSRDAYVTLTTAVSLSVFTERETRQVCKRDRLLNTAYLGLFMCQ